MPGRVLALERRQVAAAHRELERPDLRVLLDRALRERGGAFLEPTCVDRADPRQPLLERKLEAARQCRRLGHTRSVAGAEAALCARVRDAASRVNVRGPSPRTLDRRLRRKSEPCRAKAESLRAKALGVSLGTSLNQLAPGHSAPTKAVRRWRRRRSSCGTAAGSSRRAARARARRSTRSSSRRSTTFADAARPDHQEAAERELPTAAQCCGPGDRTRVHRDPDGASSADREGGLRRACRADATGRAAPASSRSAATSATPSPAAGGRSCARATASIPGRALRPISRTIEPPFPITICFWLSVSV